MPRTKREKDELVKVARTDQAIVAVDVQVAALMRSAAQLLSLPLAPAELAKLFSKLNQWTSNIDDLQAAAKARVLALVEADGAQTTEKGSKQLVVDTWLLEIRPHRTGLDSKKVEAVLRAKTLNPAEHMDTVVTYAVNPGKLEALVASGKLSTNELAACKYDLKWAVQSPKRVDDAS